MTGNEFAGPGGLHDIADTDAWLDAVGRPEVPDGDPLAAALSTLLADADREYRPVVSMPDVARPRNRGGAAGDRCAPAHLRAPRALLDVAVGRGIAGERASRPGGEPD